MNANILCLVRFGSGQNKLVQLLIWARNIFSRTIRTLVTQQLNNITATVSYGTKHSSQVTNHYKDHKKTFMSLTNDTFSNHVIILTLHTGIPVILLHTLTPTVFVMPLTIIWQFRRRAP